MVIGLGEEVMYVLLYYHENTSLQVYLDLLKTYIVLWKNTTITFQQYLLRGMLLMAIQG